MILQTGDAAGEWFRALSNSRITLVIAYPRLEDAGRPLILHRINIKQRNPLVICCFIGSHVECACMALLAFVAHRVVASFKAVLLEIEVGGQNPGALVD